MNWIPGYVYIDKFKNSCNFVINTIKLIYIDSEYDGDINGNGYITYKFINYYKKFNYNKIDINNIVKIKLLPFQSLETSLGEIQLDKNIIPYDIKYTKKVIEYYELFQKNK